MPDKAHLTQTLRARKREEDTDAGADHAKAESDLQLALSAIGRDPTEDGGEIDLDELNEDEIRVPKYFAEKLGGTLTFTGNTGNLEKDTEFIQVSPR